MSAQTQNWWTAAAKDYDRGDFRGFNKPPAPEKIGWFSSHWIAAGPGESVKLDRPFERLLIMQDTGGTIRGPVRGDVYWGYGTAAASIAGARCGAAAP